MQVWKRQSAYPTHAQWSEICAAHTLFGVPTLSHPIKRAPYSDETDIFMVCKCDTASALTPLVHSGAVGVGELGDPGGPKRLSHPRGHGAEGGQAAVEEDGGHPRVATSSLRTSGRRREGRDGDH